MNRSDYRLHPAANIEVTHDAQPLGLGARHQIIQNSVDCPLVEDPVVPVAPKIELETLQFDALRRWNVCDANRSEIGRASLQHRELLGVALDTANGAKGRKLRAVHVDLVVTAGVRIVESLEELWAWHPRTMHR